MGMRARAVARRDDDGARARMRVTNASAARPTSGTPHTSSRARMSSTSEVRELLERAFAPCAELDVVDVSGECGSAFEVRVVSEKFRGQSRIQSHRAIHDALASVMEKIHALSVKVAKAP
jgi:BolA protein